MDNPVGEMSFYVIAIVNDTIDSISLKRTRHLLSHSSGD